MPKIALKRGHAKPGKFQKYRRYEFDSLKKSGDYFIVTDPEAFDSVRAQASKQGVKRKIRISVTRVDTGVCVQHVGAR